MEQTRRMVAACVLGLLAAAQSPAQTTPAARAQGAATRNQADQTERANRDATVADETGTIHGSPPTPPARPAPAASEGAGRQPPLPPAYGPVLHPRGERPAGVPANKGTRKDPAEVHDETDTLARPSAPGQQAGQAQQPKPPQGKQQTRRHPAWQGAGPLAPRPLQPPERSLSAGVPVGSVPVAPPASAPQPPARGSAVLNSCQGNFCTDAAGNSYNAGSNGTAIGSGGRLCTRGTATVQCL